MEPENTPLEKENHLPNYHFQVQAVNLPRCIGQFRFSGVSGKFQRFSKPGNVAVDALSAQKYYHLVRLMGRSASNIALEVVWCSAVAAFEIFGHWVIGMWDN